MALVRALCYASLIRPFPLLAAPLNTRRQRGRAAQLQQQLPIFRPSPLPLSSAAVRLFSTAQTHTTDYTVRT